MLKMLVLYFLTHLFDYLSFNLQYTRGYLILFGLWVFSKMFFKAWYRYKQMTFYELMKNWGSHMLVFLDVSNGKIIYIEIITGIYLLW